MSGGLALCVQSGAVDRVHYALVLAAAALATNRPVTLFLTGEAVWLAAAQDGWQRLLPDSAQRDALAFEAHLAQRRLGGLLELRDACCELGAEFLVCEMALRQAGLPVANLDPALSPSVCGAVTFLAKAEQARTSLFL